MGSKGVPNKNIRLLNGVPLIVHSIRQANQSGLFAELAVSSDSQQILDIAGAEGVTYLIRRPDELATDTAAKIPAIQHCVLETERLAGHEFQTLVDLDSTSPLRSIKDIQGAVDLLESRGVSNVITAAPARRSPYFNLVELHEGAVTLSKPGQTFVRRQDAPKCFDMNASIYVWERKALLEGGKIFYSDTLLFEMPEERSVDIDSELDFKVVELLMKEHSGS
jgi:N-acylneuraminate cytidylyltransferase/CMP-N,N'-diacetyllegionaminic acid synthase